MRGTCRLQPEELIAYRDATLPLGRCEIVEAHLEACSSCQERLAAYDEVDRIIQQEAVTPAFPARRRATLHIRLQQEADRRQNWFGRVKFGSSLLARPLVTGLLVLLVLLAAMPMMTEAGFPLGHLVHFGKVEIKEALPLDAQEPIHHVAPSDPDTSGPSFQAIAPANLPSGLVRTEQSVPGPDRIELLYRDAWDTAILVTEMPAGDGKVTLEAAGIDLSVVRGTDVLWVRDSRPEAIAAFYWERGGVYFEVLVTEAPPGAYGGLRRADALAIVEGLMDAQDTMQK